MTAHITVEIQQVTSTTWEVALYRNRELVTSSEQSSFEEASNEAVNLLRMATTLEERKAGAA